MLSWRLQIEEVGPKILIESNEGDHKEEPESL